jgi:hypothetical protein
MRTTIAVILSLTAFAAVKDAPSTPAAVYGGIEIGSRGVKARLFSFTGNGDSRAVRQHFSKSINTALVSSMVSGKFTPEAIREVSQAVSVFVRDLKSAAESEKLGPLEIFAVASSGVAKGSNRADLLEEIRRASGVEAELAGASTEGLDGLISAIPAPRRDESLLIDTGSGNTTAGCLVDGNYRSAEIPYGSVSLRNAAIDSADYESALQSVLDRTVKPDYRRQTLNRPCLANRGRIYWIGGAAWAAATFLHPEHAANAYVEITRAELDQFLAKLKNRSWNATPPRAPAALQEWKDVQNVFAREDVLAGVAIFRSLLDLSNPNARILFARNGSFLYGHALSRYVERKP